MAKKETLASKIRPLIDKALVDARKRGEVILPHTWLKRAWDGTAQCECPMTALALANGLEPHTIVGAGDAVIAILAGLGLKPEDVFTFADGFDFGAGISTMRDVRISAARDVPGAARLRNLRRLGVSYRRLFDRGLL